jgi:hypothetical protein
MPERPPLVHVRGRLNAVAVILDLPAEPLAGLLPDGLEFLPQAVLPDGRHPLVLLFGEQSAVGPNLFPLGLRYRELVLALPYVGQRDGPPGPFCYLPVLLLDRRLPTLLGRWLYGFAKRRVAWTSLEDGCALSRLEDGGSLLAARWTVDGSRERADAQASFARVRCLFQQPLISRGRGGRFRHARFEFALARARVEPVTAEILFHQSIRPGMPLGPGPIRTPGPGGPAAFRIQTDWTLARAKPEAERPAD